ncbi:uncharacterized protein LOC135834794 [Planococcus citri]|uniref:uncharacterized protein LOC135834794 n=1 Tax=Planococcus citri TaxID=170843 RepID=UPI0031F9DC9B
MNFVRIKCNLIFLLALSVYAVKFVNGRPSLEDKLHNKHEVNSNKTSKSEKFVKKSDLEDLVRLKSLYLVKNYIEEFETHLGLRFQPDWSQINVASSPARQSIEIRRQKWQYIFDNFNDSHIVTRLNSEMAKAGINQTTFCNDIADVYFTLSLNPYIFNNRFDPHSNQSIGTLLQKKCVIVFMNSVSGSELSFEEDEEKVQIPKSLYVELMRKDAHAFHMKRYYEDRLRSLKYAFQKKIIEDGKRFEILYPNIDVPAY